VDTGRALGSNGATLSRVECDVTGNGIKSAVKYTSKYDFFAPEAIR